MICGKRARSGLVSGQENRVLAMPQGGSLQIPKHVDYAARAIIELALRRGQGLIPTSEIADRRGIPHEFLNQVLLSLRKAGIIRSRRGPSGGYELADVPESITLLQVVRAMGELGETPDLACIQNGSCTVFEACVLQDVWRDLASSLGQVLGAITIDDLVRREKAQQILERTREMYYI